MEPVLLDDNNSFPRTKRTNKSINLKQGSTFKTTLVPASDLHTAAVAYDRHVDKAAAAVAVGRNKERDTVVVVGRNTDCWAVAGNCNAIRLETDVEEKEGLVAEVDVAMPAEVSDTAVVAESRKLKKPVEAVEDGKMTVVAGAVAGEDIADAGEVTVEEEEDVVNLLWVDRSR